MNIAKIAAMLLLGGAAFAEAAPQKVTFVTEDGVTLVGTLTQQGPNYVILSSQHHTSQYMWQDFAQELVDRGYSVLTYDYRGNGDSQGEQNVELSVRDVVAAYQFLQARGAQAIALVGASMGASLSYKAGLAVKGAVLVSPGFTIADPAALTGPQGPVLFITSSYDFSRKDTEALFTAAKEPKQFFLARGQDHGAGIIDGADERVRPLIYEFLKKSFR